MRIHEKFPKKVSIRFSYQLKRLIYQQKMEVNIGSNMISEK